jgi:hypothetical protein
LGSFSEHEAIWTKRRSDILDELFDLIVEIAHNFVSLHVSLFLLIFLLFGQISPLRQILLIGIFDQLRFEFFPESDEVAC